MYKFLKHGTHFLQREKRVSFKQQLPIVGSYIKTLTGRYKVLYINGYNAKIDVSGVVTSINLATTPYIIDRTTMRSFRLSLTGVESNCPASILSNQTSLTISLDTVKYYLDFIDSNEDTFVTSDNQQFQSLSSDYYYTLPTTITVVGCDYVYNRTTDTQGSIVLSNINQDVYIKVEAQLHGDDILAATSAGELLLTSDDYFLALLEG